MSRALATLVGRAHAWFCYANEPGAEWRGCCCEARVFLRVLP